MDKMNKARVLFDLPVNFSKGDLSKAYAKCHSAARGKVAGAPLPEEVESAYRTLFKDLKRRGVLKSF